MVCVPGTKRRRREAVYTGCLILTASAFVPSPSTNTCSSAKSRTTTISNRQKFTVQFRMPLGQGRGFHMQRQNSISAYTHVTQGSTKAFERGYITYSSSPSPRHVPEPIEFKLLLLLFTVTLLRARVLSVDWDTPFKWGNWFFFFNFYRPILINSIKARYQL